MSCLFCKIAAREIPARVIHETDTLLAFHDISPAAPVHVLIVPKRHIATLVDLTQEEAPLVGDMVITARTLAESLGVATRGFRLVWNAGADGGQSVFHIHLHLLGGRGLAWPPG